MLHANTEQAKKGATFNARRTPKTARQVVISLVEDNPQLSRDELFAKFQKIIDVDVSLTLRESVDWYFFTNMYTYAETSHSRSGAERAAREARVIEKAASVKAQIELLFLPMPNGKIMRYCTGREMGGFGKAYARIAKRVGAKTVGEVLNEDEVRGLMTPV